MDHAIAKRWVKALRSGRYKQGTDSLRQGDKHCCLGVLCRILRTPYTIRADGTFIYDSSPCYLSVSTMNKIGAHPAWPSDDDSQAKALWRMSLENPILSGLITLNDEGATFVEIADVIEASWKDI